MSAVGPQELRRRLAALRSALRARGEVYVDGARNVKLAEIHRHGAIRAGAHTVLGKQTKRQRAAAFVAQTDRSLSADARERLIRQSRRSAVTRGVLPARNFFFLAPAEARRVQSIVRRGVEAVARGEAPSMDAALRAATELAAQFVRAHIAPDGRLGAEHRGLAGTSATAIVQEGERMAPLSRDYRARKLKQVGPKPVLVRTGEMRGAVRARVGGG